ncbi:Gfo/Idh/MocA family protein [Microbacterium sp. 179-I 1D1 NHS]|uniref:Gfo/Idh/MocA family protein n=1 Tax=Microbacterium sp. 179-I 1D1 NHS TaxID=3374298 RepID=UPI0038792DE9
MTALRWGILATGGIAHAFTADLKTAGLTVTAVGSRRPESAQEFAAKYGIPRSYGSYEELVADPEVDIVYIATPHSHHLACATLALEHGKHVLIEKPLTLDADQAVAIRDRAAEHGLLAMEAMWTRYLPHMVRLREILAAGVIGEVRVLSADHTQNLPTDPDHRLNDLALGGGALLDLGIYPVSFAWDVLGAPAEILATAQLGETGADTDVAISVRHASGGVSSLLTSMRGAGANAAQIVGTKGRIEIDGVFYAPTSFRVFDIDGAVVEEFRTEIEGRGMQFQALYAEQLIAEGRTDSELLPINESVAIMGTLDEIRRQIGVVYPRS